jgi:two-component sensor histidine kinase
MLARWSLRPKLAAAIIAAALPILALAVWWATDAQREFEDRRMQGIRATAQLAAGRYSEVVEGSRRLLAALCSDDDVDAATRPDATPADINRCEAYLGRVLGQFPDQYSTAVVTDAQGVARCSNLSTAIGVGFADREVFGLVRQSKTFVLGAQVASRVATGTIVPAALPVLHGGEFRGMCVVGIPLSGIGNVVAPPLTTGPVTLAVVDRLGGSVGRDPQATRALPVAARLAASIVGGQLAFREYGPDGSLYQFQVLPLSNSGLYVVAAAAIADGFRSFIDIWGGVFLVVLTLVIALAVVWLGANRWCLRPLRYIRDFADRVARGEDFEFETRRAWGPELASVGEGVKSMARAITSREAELRSGLEQRDHMLREIHHRVKNNLQMISSLLNLQAGEIRSPRIRRFFGDAQNRVLTLSILHRHLYERSSWALVDFQQFISDLVRQISVGRRAPDGAQLRYHIRAPIMAVGPDIAIPIGLIVTEAVSSALDRSFDGVAVPEVRIEAGDKDSMIELVIEDNSTGKGGSIGPQARGGFGLTLIRGLAMQLGGQAEIALREGGGTRVSVTFPMPEEPAENA